jgi:hypothetical protein
MGLLNATSDQSWYTVRSHYYDSRSRRYVYRWQPVKWLDNFQALNWSTGLGEQLGLQSENVLFQWDGQSWQRIA